MVVEPFLPPKKIKPPTVRAKSDTICPLCNDIIIEASAKNGQESIQCDGSCNAWLHRWYAGLTKQAFKVASESNEKFCCSACRLLDAESEIKSLKKRVETLETQLSSLISKPADQGPLSYACAVGSPVTPTLPTTKPAKSFNPVDSGRKFNIIVFGIEESACGTSRGCRQSEDILNVPKVLSDLDSSISPLSIKDSFRLGKFVPNSVRPRPLMVKFIRSTDASSVLSKSSQLSSPYLVKPDRSIEERKKDQCLDGLLFKVALSEGALKLETRPCSSTILYWGR